MTVKGLTDSYLQAWRRLLEFDGRTSRSSFWQFMLLHFINSVFFVLLELVTRSSAAIALDLFYSVISFLPFFAASIRRLHDTNRSGWWLLSVCIPVFGILIVIYLLLQPSDENGERFDSCTPLPN